MIKLLAFDVATQSCSAVIDDGVRHWARSSDEPRSHAQLLLPFIDELVQESGSPLANLDAIALTHGPGSFTGIRIGISVAQGLSYSTGLPVILVSSLDALAYGFVALSDVKIQATCSTKSVQDGDCIVTALDARMNEVYWAAYKIIDGLPYPMISLSLCSVNDFQSQWQDLIDGHEGDVYGVGDGWGIPLIIEQAKMINIDVYADQCSSAEAVLAYVKRHWLGMGSGLSRSQKISQLSCPASSIEPLYLRNEITWKKRERIRSVE